MTDFIGALRGRSQQIRLERTVLVKKEVCGFIYCLHRDGQMARIGPDGKETPLSRSEAEDTFTDYEMALHRQEMRQSLTII